MSPDDLRRLDGQSDKPTVYLAGPDVFLSDPLAQAEAKKAVLAEYGLEGQFPLDNQLSEADLARHDGQIGMAISDANETLMRNCETVIANMTPYHGRISMDVGTAFEMGFMRASGKPVFGYTNDPRTFADRVVEERYGGQTVQDTMANGQTIIRGASDKLGIEDFGLNENLMMQGAIKMSGGTFGQADKLDMARAGDEQAYVSDLTAFKHVARQVAEHYYGPEQVAQLEAARGARAERRASGGWTDSVADTAVADAAPKTPKASNDTAPGMKR